MVYALLVQYGACCYCFILRWSTMGRYAIALGAGDTIGAWPGQKRFCPGEFICPVHLYTDMQYTIDTYRVVLLLLHIAAFLWEGEPRSWRRRQELGRASYAFVPGDFICQVYVYVYIHYIIRVASRTLLSLHIASFLWEGERSSLRLDTGAGGQWQF